MNLPPLEWLPRSNAVNLLAGFFLLSALYAVSQRRARACISAYAWNSRSLAAIALLVALVTGARAIAVTAALVLLTKGLLIPRLLHRAARRAGARDPSEPMVAVPAGLLLCGGLVVVAFQQTRAMLGTGTTILASCLPVSVAATLVGLFLMVSRRQALAQVIGLVIVENAVFLAAVSLTYGMPLVVEIGVLLDLLAGAALLGVFVGRIDETPDGADTTRLLPPGD
jgi:hydrogenase-4 component E